MNETISELPVLPIIYRILVKPKIYKNVSKGGIVLSASKHDQQLEQAAVDIGKVLYQAPAAGKFFEERYKTKWPIKVGDYVQWQRGTGQFYEEPKTKEIYVMLGDEDLISKIPSNHIDEADYE